MEDACRFFERHLTDERRRHLWTRYGLMPDFVEVMRIGYARRTVPPSSYISWTGDTPGTRSSGPAW